MEKSKEGIEALVEVEANWLCPPSSRSKVRVVPEGTVATGGSELSHFRWREDLEMWIVWDILGGDVRCGVEPGWLLGRGIEMSSSYWFWFIYDM